MKILYSPNEGFVVSVSPLEPNTIIRTMEVLIEAFESDCDVSFLKQVLEEAKQNAVHTLN